MRISLLATLLLAVAVGTAPAQGPGPGDGDAVLRFPGNEPVRQPVAPPAPGAEALSLFDKNPNSPVEPRTDAGSTRLAPKLTPPNQEPDPNQDILVDPKVGPWMVSVMSYSGDDAPQLARQFVIELRNTYKLPAYVFNRGAEERQKEYERVKAQIEKRRQILKENGVAADYPLRFPHIRIEEQCAVLVGGYADDTAANRALVALKQLPPPDSKKVPLDPRFFGTTNQNAQPLPSTESGVNFQVAKVNPFRSAFVVRNPSIKVDRPQEWDKFDMSVLRKLNAGEPYSLLQCKKPVTLVIKLLQTPTIVQPKSFSGAFLENIGLGHSSEDAAAVSAHSLAEYLHKANLKAFVLHTKYFSLVTVGEFEGIDDPSLRAMQNALPEQLKNLQFAQLFPTPMPLQVPR